VKRYTNPSTIASDFLFGKQIGAYLSDRWGSRARRARTRVHVRACARWHLVLGSRGRTRARTRAYTGANLTFLSETNHPQWPNRPRTVISLRIEYPQGARY